MTNGLWLDVYRTGLEADLPPPALNPNLPELYFAIDSEALFLRKNGSWVRLNAPAFSTVAELLADDTITASVPGRLWSAEGYTYSEAAASATDQDVTTAGGIKLYALPIVPSFAYEIEQIGGGVSNTTNNAALANALIAKIVAAGGGTLAFRRPGVYQIEQTKANPYKAGRCCIDISGSNVAIEIGPQSTLRLRNAQQTNATGAVELIAFGGVRDNIRIYGGGKIQGNTAGQTGWTGGYLQATAGCLINGTAGSGNLFTNILVEDLTLEDSWSNPAFVTCAPTNRGRNIVFRNLTCINNGEGAWIGYADGMRMENITQLLTSSMTMAGDGIEVEVCEDFVVSGFKFIRTAGTANGSAIELFGSANGLVTDYYVRGHVNLFGLGQPAGRTTNDITIRGGRVEACVTGGGPLWIWDNHGDVLIEDLEVTDCVKLLFLMQDNDTARPPIRMRNVRGKNTNVATISGARRVIWEGGGNINSPDRGIDITQAAAGQTRNIEFRDLDFRGAVSFDIRFNDASLGGMIVNGIMHDCWATSPADIGLGASANVYTGLNVRWPVDQIGNPAASVFPDAAKFTRLIFTNLTALTTLNNPSQAQVLRLVSNEASGTANIIHGTGNIFLDGAVDFAMARGDSLTLEFRTASEAAVAGWYEIGRVVIA